eukprot:763418-Hanusia_phi.AAC.28
MSSQPAPPALSLPPPPSPLSSPMPRLEIFYLAFLFSLHLRIHALLDPSRGILNFVLLYLDTVIATITLTRSTSRLHPPC